MFISGVSREKEGGWSAPGLRQIGASKWKSFKWGEGGGIFERMLLFNIYIA